MHTADEFIPSRERTCLMRRLDDGSLELRDLETGDVVERVPAQPPMFAEGMNTSFAFMLLITLIVLMALLVGVVIAKGSL